MQHDYFVEIPQALYDFFNNQMRIGHIATIRPDGSLSVVPVGVVIHDGQVRISAPSSTFKVRNLLSNPQVAVSMTDPDDQTRYVTIRGFAELTDDEDRAFVTWLARTHMGREEYPYESARTARTVITIRPRKIIMPKVHGSK